MQGLREILAGTAHQADLNPMKINLVKNFEKGRGGHSIRAVVCHITGGSSASALSWFSTPVSFASAHYLIDEVGEVHLLVKEEDTAWHTGKVVRPRWSGLKFDDRGSVINPNLYTIGVEVALLNGRVLPGWKQWKAWASLVREICFKYSIPQNELGIVHHNEIRADKECPGFWINRQWLKFL